MVLLKRMLCSLHVGPGFVHSSVPYASSVLVTSWISRTEQPQGHGGICCRDDPETWAHEGTRTECLRTTVSCRTKEDLCVGTSSTTRQLLFASAIRSNWLLPGEKIDKETCLDRWFCLGLPFLAAICLRTSNLQGW